MTLRWPVPVCVAALVLGAVHAGTAQETIEKPITIYVAGTAGGGVDLYARLLGRHFGRHVPGKPSVTVQVMPGAGGIRAANFLAEQAPRDGTAITTFAGGPILEPLIGARNPGYDMSAFTWLGAMTKDIGLCIAWGESPFKTIDDVRRKQMVVAGTGAGSETDTWPIVLNDVLGTKFKLVTGYLGSQETILAIERGEAHGRCVFSQSALKIAKPDWLRDHKINVLVLTALHGSPDFPGVPAVVDLVSKPQDRQLLELFVSIEITPLSTVSAV
jgi:tripartite-type tricarboxylate transporter receptor subunit TctC